MKTRTRLFQPADEPAVIDQAPPAADTPVKTGWEPSDHKADIDKYFAADEAKNGPPAKDEAAAPVVKKVEALAPVVPKPSSLADQLVAKHAPVVKKEEVAPPPAPDSIDEIDKKMQEANPKWKPNEGWNNLKTIAKTERQKAAELAAKLADTETKLRALPVAEGMTSDELKKLRDEHKAYSERVMLLDLQSHPQFKDQFIAPRDAELGRARELLEAHGVKADVASLLAKPRAELGKAVQELTKDLPPFDQTEIAEAVRKAYGIEQSGKVALANSKDILRNIQAKTQENQRAAFETEFLPASQEIAQHLIKLEAAPDATPEERAEVEAYIEGGKQIKAQAEKYAFAVSDDRQAARIAMKAAAYDFHVATVQPRMAKEIAKIYEDNRRMAEELKALHGKNPNRKVSGNVERTDTAPKRMEDMTHAEAADHIARGGN